MAIAALILGIISIILCWIPFINWVGIITSIAGIILGALGKKDPSKSGMATAGMVLSIIALVIAVIGWIACGACAACA